LENLIVDYGMPLELTLRTEFQEIERINLAWDVAQWRAVVNPVVCLSVP